MLEVVGLPVATARIVEALAARRDALASATLAQIQQEIPAYARLEDPALLSDITEHIAQNHDALRESLARRRPVASEDLAFIRPHAALRARRGVSVADFMHALLIGQRVVWDAVIGLAADDSEIRGAALAAAGSLMEFADHASTHAADAFLEEQQLLMAEGDRVRRDLLEDLLAGRDPATGARLAAARAAGLEPGTACRVIVAVPRSPREYPLRSAGSALERALGASRSRLMVARHEEIVIAYPTGEEDLGAVIERLGEEWRGLSGRSMRLAVGISTEHPSPAALPDAYREARLAADALGADGGVLALPSLSAFEYLTLGGDGIAGRLISPAITRFLDEDEADGGELTATLIAYARSDLNVRRTSEGMHMHVNTTHYRLARIAERTGCDLRRLADVVELLIAVGLRGQRGATAGGSAAALARDGREGTAGAS